MNNIAHKFTVPIYDVSVLVTFSEAKLLKLAGVTDSPLGFCGEREGKIIVFIREDEGLSINTVAHEAYHLVDSVMDLCGVDYGGSNEHVAYLVGWVAEKITECYQGETNGR